jgi:type III pantothenate kinase
MNLCIDIGNTRAKFAIYGDNHELYYHRSEHLDTSLLYNLKEKHNLNRCILSTTRILEAETMGFLESNFELMVLDEKTLVPIKNNYATPATLGKDRLSAAVAANALFGSHHCIIIDAGTCLTYNFIDSEGVYYGGNIAPGVNMRLQAMHTFTDKLPIVDQRYNSGLFGIDTMTALQNGAVKGAIYELTSFIEQVFAKYGETKIILTGGDAIIFAKHLKFKIFAHPNLVLLGLNEILKFNANLFKS